MTKTIRPGLVIAGIAVVMLAGCGLPASGPATTIEEVPRDSAGDSYSDSLPSLGPTVDAEETVLNFLGAAAGDWANRDERLNKFVRSEATWSESSAGMPLVRLDSDKATATSSSTTSATVEVTGTIVGVYNQYGQVKKASGDLKYSREFTLSREYSSDHWHIDAPPEQVVIDEEIFGNRYLAQPLYFPATSDTTGTLVPDLRWIPKSLSDTGVRYERLLDWLLTGPSEWLESSVSSGIPTGTSREAISVHDDGVVVEISARSATSPVDKYEIISAQLAWTLGLESDQRLTLVVDGREQLESKVSDWAKYNRAPGREDGGEDRDLIYYIQNGVIKSATSDAPFAGTAPEGLQEAALEPGGGRMAAVVFTEIGRSLMVGAPGELERVADFTAAELSDPQWIDRSKLLVLADGEPTMVRVSTGESVKVSMSELDSTITAISLAPDSRRLAFVADGRTYVAPISYTDDFSAKLGEPQRVGLNVTGVRDVGWSQETHLVMIGLVPEAEEWLWQVSIDNAYQQQVEGTKTSTTGAIADSLSVRCNSPQRSPAIGQPLVVSVGNSIARVYTASYSPLQVEDEDGNEVDAIGNAPFVTG